MGNLMKKLKKTKMVKQFGILSLVLAMLIGVMSNGTIINAVDGNADANITFNSRIVEKVNGQDVDVSQADSGIHSFWQFIMLFQQVQMLPSILSVR